MSPWASGDSLTPSTLNRNLASGVSSALTSGWRLFNAGDYGALTPDGTDAVKSAISAANIAGGGVVFVPSRTSWSYATSYHSENVQIFDLSGFDDSLHTQSAQIKFILRTDNPGQKDAHEFIAQSLHHPAFAVNVLSNVPSSAYSSNGGLAMASLVFRRDSLMKWITGMYPGTSASVLDCYRIWAVNSAGDFWPVFTVAGDDQRIGFNNNSPHLDGVAWVAQSSITSSPTFRWGTRTPNDSSVITTGWYSGSTTTRASESVDSVGVRTFYAGDNTVIGSLSSGTLKAPIIQGTNGGQFNNNVWIGTTADMGIVSFGATDFRVRALAGRSLNLGAGNTDGYVSISSTGIVSLNTISVRTTNASLTSLTVGVNELAVFVGGASGATLALRSGGTIYYFASSSSTVG